MGMLDFVIGYAAGSQTASRAASLARDAAIADGTIQINRIEDLNERIDSLAMIMRAMWALLEEQGLTQEQLIAKIDELDLLDGIDDGQMRREPVDCPKCDSKVAPGLTRCQYCGAEIELADNGPLSTL
jgi:DNA-directed RNA polymerase subunit RPC12/RpoP